MGLPQIGGDRGFRQSSGDCPQCEGDVSFDGQQYVCTRCDGVVDQHRPQTRSPVKYHHSGRYRMNGGFAEAYEGDGEYEFGDLAAGGLLARR